MPYGKASDNRKANSMQRREAAIRLSEQQREAREEKDIQTGGLLGALIGGVIGTVISPGAGTSIGASIGRKAGEIAGGRDPELSDLTPGVSALSKMGTEDKEDKGAKSPESAFLSILPSLLSKGA